MAELIELEIMPDHVHWLVEGDPQFGIHKLVLLYARSGVFEVWLVDLSTERVEVYRKPAPHGYQESRTVGRGHHLAPQALPDLDLSVEAVLG